jgi:hypothetical protein
VATCKVSVGTAENDIGAKDEKGNFVRPLGRRIQKIPHHNFPNHDEEHRTYQKRDNPGKFGVEPIRKPKIGFDHFHGSPHFSGIIAAIAIKKLCLRAESWKPSGSNKLSFM